MPRCSARRCSRANCELSRLSTTAPPGSTACEDFRLGVGDRLDAGEEFEMHRLDRGDRPRTCGRTIFDQRRDLAGVVHADLEDRKRTRGRAARQRQRHAPVIVEGGGRGVASAPARQARGAAPPWCWSCRPTGDRDHLRRRRRARAARARSTRAVEHVVRRPAAAHRRRILSRWAVIDHRQRRALRFKRARADEIMAVMDVALDREIGLARLRRCGCRWKGP